MISLGEPKNTSIARSRSFNKTNVDLFLSSTKSYSMSISLRQTEYSIVMIKGFTMSLTILRKY